MFPRQFIFVAIRLLVILTFSVLGHSFDQHDEVPSIRSFFYVGGEYVDNGSGEHIVRGQMYVEKLSPAVGTIKNTPIVFVHGKGQTGTNFLNKPGGGRGWVSRFIAQGYEVYIVDQTFRGRSAWLPEYDAEEIACFSAEDLQERFTATREYGLWPQAINHTQWPGTGKMGDPIFDAFYGANVQYIENSTRQQRSVQAAGVALLKRIAKPVILLGHSQGGTMLFLIADGLPELTKALILLEPTGPPFIESGFNSQPARAWGLTDISITYEPPVVDPATDLVKQTLPARDTNSVECVLQSKHSLPRKLVHLASKPILVVTGEASYHMAYDYCTVEYLKQAGCSGAELLELGSVGIHGNGHMFFMEQNSDEIQQVLQDWIKFL